MSHTFPETPETPATRSVALLPRPLTGFVGRERQRSALTALLAAPHIRLLTLTGPGGIGKTRLALELIPTLQNAFPDGIAFVPLASTNNPDHVLAGIARTLGIDPASGLNLDDALDRVLRDRRMLLVLDNLEHLLPAGPILSGLLQAHSRLTIFATSRTRLGLSGEHVFPLEPLSPGDARSLFRQRSNALSLGRRQDDDTATIDAICARLDRIPLAIELAAARTATLSPAALLDRLARPLDLLRNGPRDLPLRHHTMRDTIAWSYELLDESQRAGFRRLSVFVGGFTLDGAQAVLGNDLDALDLVEFLVARSLVVPMQGELSVPRFTMLESIRQFGLEQLSAEQEAAATRTAHVDYLIRLIEHAVPLLDGPLLHQYLSIVNDELDNVRAAIAWTIEQHDGERACRITGGFWRFWGSGESHWRTSRTIADVLQEGRRWTERAIAISETAPAAYVVEAMSGLGLLMDTMTEKEVKRGVMTDLLSRAHAASLPHGEYWAHFGLADIARVEGDWTRARQHAEAAIALAPLIRDSDNQRCGAEIHLAGIFHTEGDYHSAETHLQLALEFGERAGNPHHLALAMLQLVRTSYRLDRPTDTIGYILKSLDLLHALDDSARTRIPILTLAELALASGFHTKAIQFLAFAATVPQYIDSIDIDEARIAPFRSLVPEPRFSREWQVGAATPPAEMYATVRTFAAALEREASPPPTVLSPTSLLSPREEEVLHLLVAGRTNRVIGEELFISERTVEKHVLHIMTKLDLDSRTGIVAWAVRNGVVA